MDDRRLPVPLLFLFALLLIAAPALAHVDRPSYWPDPAPDCSIKPCTGGGVPTARSLASALDKKAVGKTRVVCQKDSLKLLRQSIARARKDGYDIRPTDHRSLSKKGAARLLAVNKTLFARCSYAQIQTA